MDVLTFLRDVGKYFSINNMIQKESVKQRIEREGSGISFTEFTYMILQSYDFSELYRQHQCGLQIGGSDQWGNITGGIDLTRRLHGGQAFGLTMPLVEKADGTKFGKTESGTIWLDAHKTSPYSFYQFWLNTSDTDVYKFLRYFTFLSVEDIAAIEAADATREGRPQGQQILADEVTKLVHGEEGLAAAQRITQALFVGEAYTLGPDDLEQLALDGLPTTALSAESLAPTLTQLLCDVGMVTSGKQVKDASKNKAVFINGVPVDGAPPIDTAVCFQSDNALHGQYWIVRLGKKKYHLFTAA